MELDWLELIGYRCYPNLRFEPAPGVNVLVGNNGTGKTSVLEAIAYLGLLHSFRGTPDESIVSTEAASAVLRGGFSVPSGTVRVEVELPKNGRRTILLNGKRPKRNRDVLAQVPVVAFQPDDLDVVKRGPSLRRGYLDDLAAQLRPQAAADQQEHQRALRQRNALLRQEGRSADRESLDAWDARVTAAGASVFVDRLRVLEALEIHLGEAYRLVGASGSLTWSYLSNWGAAPGDDLATAEAKLSDAMTKRRQRDLDQRTTTAGPHRDDPTLVVDGRPARAMASQGEQRTIAVSLRVGAYRLLAQERPTLPILLLDDVFSELDPLRARGVLDLLGDGQVFVTTARDDDVPLDGTRWMVEGGALR
ncbi:MAG: DNA replication/repair protein RecF [Acidimicrobiia bacterium]|nr:MAG: DNA replication/repair protein RecF [Acidimicrobiia bacterium]